MTDLISLSLKVRNLDGRGFAKIIEDLERERNRRLKQLGAYTRQTARQSIKRDEKSKRDKQKTSKAGKPPFSHTAKLKDLIRFQVEDGGNVVIGPLPFKKQIAWVVEYGGQETIKIPTEWLHGESYEKKNGRTRNKRGQFAKGQMSSARAKAIRQVNSGKLPKYSKIKVTYKPRPFMVPAFEKNLKSAIFKDLI